MFFFLDRNRLFSSFFYKNLERLLGLFSKTRVLLRNPSSKHPNSHPKTPKNPAWQSYVRVRPYTSPAWQSYVRVCMFFLRVFAFSHQGSYFLTRVFFLSTRVYSRKKTRVFVGGQMETTRVIRIIFEKPVKTRGFFLKLTRVSFPYTRVFLARSGFSFLEFAYKTTIRGYARVGFYLPGFFSCAPGSAKSPPRVFFLCTRVG